MRAGVVRHQLRGPRRRRSRLLHTGRRRREIRARSTCRWPAAVRSSGSSRMASSRSRNRGGALLGRRRRVDRRRAGPGCDGARPGSRDPSARSMARPKARDASSSRSLPLVELAQRRVGLVEVRLEPRWPPRGRRATPRTGRPGDTCRPDSPAARTGSRRSAGGPGRCGSRRAAASKAAAACCRSDARSSGRPGSTRASAWFPSSPWTQGAQQVEPTRSGWRRMQAFRLSRASPQPPGLDVVVADGQQELGGGLVGVEPHRRLERADRLAPSTLRQPLAADQEVVQRGGGGPPGGQLFLALLTRDVAGPGQAIGAAEVVGRGRLGPEPAARSRIFSPSAGSTASESIRSRS